MRPSIFAASAVFSLAVVPCATADIVETEPNNTMETADVINRGDPNWSDVGVMSLSSGVGGGDVDFFVIRLFEGEILTVITTPMEDPFVDPDTIMAIFNSDGDELAFNDDAGQGFGSAIRFLVEETGTYFIAVSGFFDRDFSGDHEEDGAYALTASIVLIPAPAGLALLAGGLMIGRRRRRG